MLDTNTLHCGNCMDVMQNIDSNSVDCIVTDPPYGLSFMGKDWDKAVPSIAIWQECLRVLKPGAFAFVMCIPRQDCLARMICRLEDAGFNVAFSSIYWTYATGFPKAQNLSKAVDKRAGVKREVVGYKHHCYPDGNHGGDRRVAYHSNKKSDGVAAAVGSINKPERGLIEITESGTDQATALDGAYGGFQPKPAVEIIIVAMKPLSERTYIDQAIANGHGCTWLDECRIPFEHVADKEHHFKSWSSKRKNQTDSLYALGLAKQYEKGQEEFARTEGRFPANVLCEDDVLDDGNITKSVGGIGVRNETHLFKGTEGHKHFHCGDSGSFSRYFSLDAWFTERIKSLPKEAQKTFPWLIVPKASKSEKNRGLEDTEERQIERIQQLPEGFVSSYGNVRNKPAPQHNFHATVKPIKLMSWLITLASREGDIVLDPFCGSGTTLIAAKMLGRQYIGIEREEDYCEIARKRVAAIPINLSEFDR